MKRLLFFLFLLIGTITGFSQATYPIRADSVRIFQLGKNGELIIENGTRAKTGAFLRNWWNGRSEWAYALDTIYMKDDSLIVHRGPERLAFLAGGSASKVILNQNSTVQPANFRIGGTGTIEGDLVVTRATDNPSLIIKGGSAGYGPTLRFESGAADMVGYASTISGVGSLVYDVVWGHHFRKNGTTIATIGVDGQPPLDVNGNTHIKGNLYIEPAAWSGAGPDGGINFHPNTINYAAPGIKMDFGDGAYASGNPIFINRNYNVGSGSQSDITNIYSVNKWNKDWDLLGGGTLAGIRSYVEAINAPTYAFYGDAYNTAPTTQIAYAFYANRGKSYFGDRVGILNNNPQYPLDVNGNARVVNRLTADQVQVGDGNAHNGALYINPMFDATSGNQTGGGRMSFTYPGGSRLYVMSNDAIFFDNLNFANTASSPFVVGVQDGSHRIQLPTTSGEPFVSGGAANATMYYQTSTDKFRGRVAGTWKNFLMEGDAAPVSGSNNYIRNMQGISGVQEDARIVLQRMTYANTIPEYGVGSTTGIHNYWYLDGNATSPTNYHTNLYNGMVLRNTTGLNYYGISNTNSDMRIASTTITNQGNGISNLAVGNTIEGNSNVTEYSAIRTTLLFTEGSTVDTYYGLYIGAPHSNGYPTGTITNHYAIQSDAGKVRFKDKSMDLEFYGDDIGTAYLKHNNTLRVEVPSTFFPYPITSASKFSTQNGSPITGGFQNLNLMTETGSGAPIVFLPNGSEKARFTPDGEFWLGNTYDFGDSKLQVNGNTQVNGKVYGDQGFFVENWGGTADRTIFRVNPSANKSVYISNSYYSSLNRLHVKFNDSFADDLNPNSAMVSLDGNATSGVGGGEMSYMNALAISAGNYTSGTVQHLGTWSSYGATVNVNQNTKTQYAANYDAATYAYGIKLTVNNNDTGYWSKGAYGLYVDASSAHATVPAYALYANTGKSYFGGDVQIKNGSQYNNTASLRVTATEGTDVFVVNSGPANSLSQPTAYLRGNISTGDWSAYGYPNFGQGNRNTFWNETAIQDLKVFKYGGSEQLNMWTEYPNGTIGYNVDRSGRNYGPADDLTMQFRIGTGFVYNYNSIELARLNKDGKFMLGTNTSLYTWSKFDVSGGAFISGELNVQNGPTKLADKLYVGTAMNGVNYGGVGGNGKPGIMIDPDPTGTYPNDGFVKFAHTGYSKSGYPFMYLDYGEAAQYDGTRAIRIYGGDQYWQYDTVINMSLRPGYIYQGLTGQSIKLHRYQDADSANAPNLYTIGYVADIDGRNMNAIAYKAKAVTSGIQPAYAFYSEAGKWYSSDLNNANDGVDYMVGVNNGVLKRMAIPSGGGGSVSAPSGEVLYGTGAGYSSSPSFTFDQSSGYPVWDVKNTGTAGSYIRITNNNQVYGVANTGDGAFAFTNTTGGYEFFRLKDGKMMVGSTTDLGSYKLQVSGVTYSTQFVTASDAAVEGLVLGRHSSTYPYSIIKSKEDNTPIHFRIGANAADQMTIGDGSVGILTGAGSGAFAKVYLGGNTGVYSGSGVGSRSYLWLGNTDFRGGGYEAAFVSSLTEDAANALSLVMGVRGGDALRVWSDKRVEVYNLNDNTGVAKMVTVTNGVLGYQAIPSGGGSVAIPNTQVAFGNSTGDGLTSTANFTFNSTTGMHKIQGTGPYIWFTTGDPNTTALVGVAGAANQIIAGTAIGDMAIRADGILWLGNNDGSGEVGMKLAGNRVYMPYISSSTAANDNYKLLVRGDLLGEVKTAQMPWLTYAKESYSNSSGNGSNPVIIKNFTVPTNSNKIYWMTVKMSAVTASGGTYAHERKVAFRNDGSGTVTILTSVEPVAKAATGDMASCSFNIVTNGANTIAIQTVGNGFSFSWDAVTIIE